MSIGYVVPVHKTYLTNMFLKCLQTESNDGFDTHWGWAASVQHKQKYEKGIEGPR